MSNENTLIDIIDDQAHAMQKLCEMLRDERAKKHVILQNVKITGDRFVVDGNAELFGTIELDLKEPLKVKGNLNSNNSVIKFNRRDLKLQKKASKCKKTKKK